MRPGIPSHTGKVGRSSLFPTLSLDLDSVFTNAKAFLSLWHNIAFTADQRASVLILIERDCVTGFHKNLKKIRQFEIYLERLIEQKKKQKKLNVKIMKNRQVEV